MPETLCDRHREQTEQRDLRLRTRTCRSCGKTWSSGNNRTGQRWGLCSGECRRAWEAAKARARRKLAAPTHYRACPNVATCSRRNGPTRCTARPAAGWLATHRAAKVTRST
jgi:hypothetical protein